MKAIESKKNGSYQNEALKKSVCLICGETIGVGDYVYRGKTLCTQCLSNIKNNY